jgi:hypothetical protein
MKNVIFIIVSLFLLNKSVRSQVVFAVVHGNQNKISVGSTLGSGLFLSKDSLKTWVHLGPENIKAFCVDAIDSCNGKVIFLGAGNGIHRTLDYGANWKTVTDWRVKEVLDIKIDQFNSNYIYAATAFGFWLSTDGGETWSNPNTPMKNKYSYKVIIRKYTSNTNSVIITGENDSIAYISNNNAKTWLKYGLCSRSCIYPTCNSIMKNIYSCISTINGLVVAGEKGLIINRVKEGTPKWVDISNNLPTPVIHSVVEYKNNLVVGTWGNGIYRFINNVWVPSGLEGTQIWSLTVKPYF